MVSDYSGTLLYHSTGTVCFQTIEFFQLTFHLVVQYKIFQDVAVKVQLVCNCTSSLGQTKAQKEFFFFLPTYLACFRGPPNGLLPPSFINSILLGRAEHEGEVCITKMKAEEA